MGRRAKSYFLAVGAALCAALALASASTAATLPPASAPAVASQGGTVAAKSCASLKKKAQRSKRGSAKRRRYIRRYRRCLARRRVQNPPPLQAPSTPAPPAPAPPAVTQPAGPIYLPSIFPNPNGYRSGAGCQPGYEQSYIAAGFSCQYAGYNHYLFSPTGPIWTPVYLLFGIWYCADGQFRFRC
jgi:hypothetical protein